MTDNPHLSPEALARLGREAIRELRDDAYARFDNNDHRRKVSRASKRAYHAIAELLRAQSAQTGVGLTTVEIAQRMGYPRSYLYRYADPFSGTPCWRHESGTWNGQTAQGTVALYDLDQIAALVAALPAQPADPPLSVEGDEAALARLKHDLDVHDAGGLAYAASEDDVALVRAEDLRAILSRRSAQPSPGGKEVTSLHWLRRIVGCTTIPDDKIEDLDFMRSAVMLANIYAACALTLPCEAPADPTTPEPAPQG